MKKWYLKNKKSVYIMCSFLLLIMIVYAAGIIYYHDKFLYNTQINGLDASNMTVAQVNSALSDKVRKQSIDLIFNDGQKETLQSQQLGISFNKDNSLTQLLNSQNKWCWFLGFFNNQELWVDDVLHIDDEGLVQGVSSLQHVQTQNQIAPVNAYIQYNNGDFVIIEENNGSLLKMDELYKNIKLALASGKSKLDISKVNGYEMPQVTKDDKVLNNKLAAAKEFCLSKISYKTKTGETITLDGGTMMDWLTQGEDGTFTRNEQVFKEKIADFVSSLAKKMNTSGETRTFTGADGSSHTVSGGNYGFKISQSAETNAILSLIKENKSEENRTPIGTGQLNGANGGLGDTFVEVNITKQHLWFHKNGAVIMESDFVSGTETKADRLTPSGTYYLYSKERNRVLRGQKKADGTYEYESPVSYWMPFNKGIGFHDASWRSQFGGQIYINSGSHGCINLPTGFAGNLYSQITVNTPVVVYR